MGRTITGPPDTVRVMRDSQLRRRFHDLFASHGADITAFCSWRAGSPSDAQDAVAEVFLTAWRRLHEVPEGELARVWLYATARRVIANQRRSSRRRAALQERLALEAVSTSDEGESSHEAPLVREALRHLRPVDREVLLLAEWEGLSPSEISVVMGCLTVTARGRLHRARRRFRAVYEEMAERDHLPDPQGLQSSNGSRQRRPVARVMRAAPIREGGS